MEEEGWWEDALDVDDSDLPSLLHPLPSLPPLRPCSHSSPPLPSNPPREPRRSAPPPAEQEVAAGVAAAPPPPRRIAGPAGAVQAAMHRQAAAVAQDRGDLRVDRGGDDRRTLGDGGEEVDEDFLLNPWLCALDFLGGNGTTSLAHPISSIRALGSTDRVAKLMGIVKSCKPNGLGDLFVTLKDPTGTIGASIHRRVIMEGNFGSDLSIGCVLVLKQVAVFSPMQSAIYLNVTLNNVVKLFGKESGPPCRQILPTLTAKCPASGKELNGEMEPVGRAHLLSQGSERSVAVESQRTILGASKTAERGATGKQRSVQICVDEVVKSTHCKRRMDHGRVECLSGISTCAAEAAIKSVGFGDVQRASLVRQGADNINHPEVIQNSNSKRRIDDGRTVSPSGELGNILNIASAATSPQRSMPGSPYQEGDHISAEQVGSSSDTQIDCGKNEGISGSFLCKTSCTSIPDSILGKPPDRVMEPKSMISKVSVAQWTDEQLSELFCDYQDDADFF